MKIPKNTLAVLFPLLCVSCSKSVEELWVGEESDLIAAWATENSEPLCVPCSIVRVTKLWEAVQQSAVNAESALKLINKLELPMRWGD